VASLYDDIGRDYTATRTTDPRLAAAIWAALGDARTVVNVGAGAGAYEPDDRQLIAIEPSEVMIAQRPPGAAATVRADASQLPFPDAGFDVAMAVLSDHHWPERLKGLKEMRRVARHRVVLFNADPADALKFWLTAEYLPGFLRLIAADYQRHDAWAVELQEALAPCRLEIVPVPIPHDCRDGFYGAFWRRPRAYLEPRVRAGISVFARLPEAEVTPALGRLRDDLESGVWERRHADLLNLDALDLGYCVVVAHLTGRPR
jgi:SAM-dependent methyltransferase